MQDTSKIKEQILTFIQEKGPSLPVSVAKQVDLSPLFASAFLSELLSNKKIITSHLRVGNSPLYFIPGQESKLKNFSDHLKSKEKEAFLLLQENKFLEDIKQEPAIRVALRAIKDFAIPFEKENKLIWRYFIIPESEFQTNQEPAQEEIEEPKKIEEIFEETQEEENDEEEDGEILEEEPIQEEEQEIKEKIEIKKEIKKPKAKKKTSNKRNEKFFNIVKEFLNNNNIEIVGIEGFSKNNLILRINKNNEEKILIAYNKKRINDADLISANKKASEFELPYIILSLGEPLKKLDNLIEAIKNLSSIEKLK